MNLNNKMKRSEAMDIKTDKKFSPYYTLYIDWNKDGNYSPEFGDWFKYIVKQEQKDSYEGETFKIIETMEVNNG